jgi:hypothetical protein
LSFLSFYARQRTAVEGDVKSSSAHFNRPRTRLIENERTSPDLQERAWPAGGVVRAGFDEFSYVPNLYTQQFDHPGVSCTQDRFGNIACSAIAWIYWQVDYKTDPGVPRDFPQAGDTWFTEWFMVETPEQSRYTTNLTLFHKNPELPEDD